MSADPRLEAVASRTATLASLLEALADSAGSSRLREGVLSIAAEYAIDTHNRLQTVLDEQS